MSAPRLNFRLSPELLAEVEAEAKDQGVSVSDVIRLSLEDMARQRRERRAQLTRELSQLIEPSTNGNH